MEQPTSAATDRRAHILNNALAAFMRYGFSRVTMEDLAREAGMSRPALYQFFRNKTDICRAGAERRLELALAATEVALAADAPLKTRLLDAMRVGILDILAEMESTPHGEELIDMKSELFGDVIDIWQNRMAALLIPVYKQAITGARFDAVTLVMQLLDWMTGMKMRLRGHDARLEALDAFLDMQLCALRQGEPV